MDADDVMTKEEIFRRFPSEWVLVADPELTPALEVVRGRVLWHSPSAEEMHRKDLELAPRRAAHLYTGKIPEGHVIVL